MMSYEDSGRRERVVLNVKLLAKLSWCESLRLSSSTTSSSGEHWRLGTLAWREPVEKGINSSSLPNTC